MTRASALGLGSAALILLGGVVAFSLMRHDAWHNMAGIVKATLPATRTAPVRPVPPAPEAAGTIRPTFDAVRVGPQGQAVIAGRAAPGAAVTVEDGGRTIGVAMANGDGEWVLLPEAPLAPGAHTLALKSTGAGAAAPESSPQTLAVLVPPRIGVGAGQGALAALLPQGEGAARALPSGPLASRAPHEVTLDLLQYDAAGRLSVSGRADPLTDLQIFLDDRRVGHSAADTRGQWSVALGDEVPLGHYRLRLDALDAGGKLVGRLTVPLQREAPAAVARAEAMLGAYTVQPGNSLWRIARRSYGDGRAYLELYRANRTLIADPDLIYPGQVLALPAAAR